MGVESSMEAERSRRAAVSRVERSPVDERIGSENTRPRCWNEPVPGGLRWASLYVSGSVLIFIMQAVTGILLHLPCSAADLRQHAVHHS